MLNLETKKMIGIVLNAILQLFGSVNQCELILLVHLSIRQPISNFNFFCCHFKMCFQGDLQFLDLDLLEFSGKTLSLQVWVCRYRNYLKKVSLRGYFSASFSRISSVIFSGFGFFSGFCLLAFKYVKILSESWDLLQAIQNTLQVTYLRSPKS